MQKFKDYELHTFSSLKARLYNLLSRPTLTSWIERGIIRPDKIVRKPNSTHLLFHKKKLEALLVLLLKGQVRQSEAAVQDRAHAARLREIGRSNAAATARANAYRRRHGQPEIPEGDPALDPDAAIGRTRLIFDPERHGQAQRIFSGGALYR
jgi:hypothetical protein